MPPMTSLPPDAELVRRARQGDQGARDLLLEDVFKRVYRYWLRLSGGREDEALDGAQETIVRVLRSLDRLRDGDRFLPWALRIATNFWMDRRRQARPFSLVDDAVAPIAREGLEDAVRELRALPDPYRIALTLRYLEGLDYDDICRILDVPGGTARSHVARGLRMLREQLDGEVTP
jgi:RNA polymerase sigma factor (sigma-70 family)